MDQRAFNTFALSGVRQPEYGRFPGGRKVKS